jgi:hypothetical protein
MLCRHCNAESPETAKFCVNCGQALSPPVGQPTETLQTAPQEATAYLSPQPRTKLAAICVWIVSAALMVLSFTAFGPSAAETQACIRAGGSGMGCGGPHFPAQLLWLAAVLGAGYGARLWARK